MAPMLGLNDINTEAMSGKLEETLNIIKKVNAQFKNAVNFKFSVKLFWFKKEIQF